jgi:hypothetical protein
LGPYEKVLPHSVADDPERLRRFALEAQAAGSLNHPNILAIYDIGTHDGLPYIVSISGRARLCANACLPASWRRSKRSIMRARSLPVWPPRIAG